MERAMQPVTEMAGVGQGGQRLSSPFPTALRFPIAGQSLSEAVGRWPNQLPSYSARSSNQQSSPLRFARIRVSNSLKATSWGEAADPWPALAFRVPSVPDERPKGLAAASVRPSEARPHWLDIYRELRSDCHRQSPFGPKGLGVFEQRDLVDGHPALLFTAGAFMPSRQEPPVRIDPVTDLGFLCARRS